jgi:hypothetical protein
MLPWLFRNYLTFGRPMLRSNFGLELRLGNNPKTWHAFKSSGGGAVAGWRMGHPSTEISEFEKYKSIGEINYADQSFHEAINFIRENPGKFLQLTLKRISQFWLSDLSAENEWAGNLTIAFSIALLKKLLHLLPIPFLLIGIFFSIRRKLKIFPLMAFVLLTPVVYYITHVSQRYRYPIEPIIIIFASYGLSIVISWIKNRIPSRTEGDLSTYAG